MSNYPEPAPYEPRQPQMVRVGFPIVKPYVTYALLAVTILIYLGQMAGQYMLGVDLLAVYGAKYGPYIRAGEIWRLVTPVFLHGSIYHIGFNMYALFIFGRGLESRFGHMRFAALYFLAGFAGNVLSFVLTPDASLGASTAIFGLITAEGIFLFQNRKLLGQQVNRAIGNIVMVAAVNLFLGMSPGIDNWGHIGGLLGGLLFAWFGGPRWKMEGIYPSMSLIDEREGHGLLAGTIAVLLFFIPIAVMGWIWPS
jgi:rhomboid protease GluP